jgi:hypothetical protein
MNPDVAEGQPVSARASIVMKEVGRMGVARREGRVSAKIEFDWRNTRIHRAGESVLNAGPASPSRARGGSSVVNVVWMSWNREITARTGLKHEVLEWPGLETLSEPRGGNDCVPSVARVGDRLDSERIGVEPLLRILRLTVGSVHGVG